MIISRLTDLLYFLFFFFFQHGAQLIKTPFNAIIKGKTVKKGFEEAVKSDKKKKKRWKMLLVTRKIPDVVQILQSQSNTIRQVSTFSFQSLHKI